MKSFFSRLFNGNTKDVVGEFEIFLDGNRNAPNVLIFTEYVNATYFISFDLPLRAMHESGNINIAVISQKKIESLGQDCWKRWSKVFSPDVVVMTRYGEPYGRQILEYYNKCNVPVVYHIDDDLLEIPESLGKEIQKRQGSKEVVQTRTFLLEHCDLIYASTNHLASLMGTRFPDQKIFHGMYAPYMGKFISARKGELSRNQIIGYMGSKGHQHDLAMIVPAIEKILNERLDVTFEVFGTIKLPPELEHFGSRVRSHSVQKSYVDFLISLSNLDWSVGLAPLVNSDFNQCKAPTKFIEYTACGIPVVASNVSVYVDVIPEGGGFLVDQDWYTPITKILDDSEQGGLMVEVSQNFCEENYSLFILEKQLIELFQLVKS